MVWFWSWRRVCYLIEKKVFQDSQSIFLAEAGNPTGHDNAALLMSGEFAEMGTFDSP